jgi:hypothetical protein
MNFICVLIILSEFLREGSSEDTSEIPEILADITDLYDIYATETKFGELKGVIIAPESNEVLWIKNACDDEHGLDQTCDFYVHNVQTLLTLEENPRCGGGISFSWIQRIPWMFGVLILRKFIILQIVPVFSGNRLLAELCLMLIGI